MSRDPGTPTTAGRKRLVKIAEAAKRGVLAHVVPSVNPPSCVLILELADREHAKAVALFVRTFTPAVVLELLASSQPRIQKEVT